MGCAISKLTKTVEEKHLQLVTLMNKLEVQNRGESIAVTALSHGSINTNELHKVVMNVEGFEEDMLDEAFDHLVKKLKFD
ncbi:hypothetical protein CFP56_024416 [Quercus suber]|uniref:Uncharacterized protein n=1 Tax=Quercus suber TaxID=58331 RepID=A0AAW0MD21_QUESU